MDKNDLGTIYLLKELGKTMPNIVRWTIVPCFTGHFDYLMG